MRNFVVISSFRLQNFFNTRLKPNEKIMESKEFWLVKCIVGRIDKLVNCWCVTSIWRNDIRLKNHSYPTFNADLIASYVSRVVFAFRLVQATLIYGSTNKWRSVALSCCWYISWEWWDGNFCNNIRITNAINKSLYVSFVIEHLLVSNDPAVRFLIDPVVLFVVPTTRFLILDLKTIMWWIIFGSCNGC